MVLVTGLVNAQPITLYISAEVAWVNDDGNLLDGRINAGDSLGGRYTYETRTRDSNHISTVGDYWHTCSSQGITVNGGGFVFKTDPSKTDFLVEIVNNHGSTGSPRDNYLLRSYNNLPLSNGALVEHISWQLDDPTASALSSTVLTQAPPSLSDWESNFGLTIRGCTDIVNGHCESGSDEFMIRAHVTSVTTKPWLIFPIQLPTQSLSN